MEINLKIGGRDVAFKSTGASLLRYKAQTGRDPIYDFLKIASAFQNGNGIFYLDESFAEIGIEPFYYMAWAFAKTAKPDIEEPMTWLDSFDEFPILEVFPQLVPLLSKSFMTSEKIKKKE